MSETIRIYLAGRCCGLEDEGKAWREEITKQLDAVAEWQNKKVKIFNPTKYYSYAEKKYKSQKQIKDYYLYQLSKCDVMILNANDTNYSIGTAQEVQYAVDYNIPIIAFGTDNMYPWIVEVDAQVLFESMHEAVDYIRDYYL